MYWYAVYDDAFCTIRDILLLFWLELLRRAIVNRTYGAHKSLSIFGPINYGPP